MEDLMELVAASFARHGIECPPADSKFVQGHGPLPVVVPTMVEAVVLPAERSSAVATPPAALLEHNFRKRLQGDPAP
ncbi:MAG: hypothetical protein ACLPN2_04565 [Terriglobales bacterium]